MLKRRLIPKFLARKSTRSEMGDYEVCISQNYSNLKMVGNLRSQLRIFESNKADEFLVINCDKSFRSLDLDFIRSVQDSIALLSTPIMVGGGIDSVDDASNLIDVGVDKVLCGISSLNHGLHTKIANLFGSQALSISIDYLVGPEGFKIGFNQQSHYTLSSFKTLIRDIENSGAGEIVLNRIDFDGTRAGLDIETLRTAQMATSVPIVISSGAGTPEHFIDAFESGADGIATGTYFAKLDQNPLQLRSRLFNAGIHIRT